jgi:hypothetical protein
MDSFDRGDGSPVASGNTCNLRDRPIPYRRDAGSVGGAERVCTEALHRRERPDGRGEVFKNDKSEDALTEGFSFQAPGCLFYL